MAAMQSLIVTSNATTLVMDGYIDKIAKAAVKIADATMKAERDSRPEIPMEVHGEQIGER